VHPKVAEIVLIKDKKDKEYRLKNKKIFAFFTITKQPLQAVIK
jgi:hypothetical protein